MPSFSTFDSLRIRDYRLLWMGQLSTSMGQWMDQVTRGWLIYELTGSAVSLGFTMAMRALPMLLFGVLAGALADRSGRKVQLIVAQVTNAILNLTLATLVLLGEAQPWHVFTTAFLAGTVQAFQQPARQTLISDIVGNEKMMNALALNSMAVNCSRTFGPALSGIFIATVGIEGSYYIQAGLYAFATLWTGQMHVPTRASLGRVKEPILQSIRAGFRYVAKTPDIRTLMLLALGPLTFGMSYTSMMPIVAREILDGGAPLQGFLLSCVGIGSLIGAIFIASQRRTHGYGLPIVVGAACFSLAIMGFGSSHLIPLSVGLGFCIGLFNVTYQTQNQTMLQLLTPREMRGRVMSIYSLDRGFVPLGAMLAGFLAATFGGEAALRIMGGIAFCIVVLVVASRPQFLKLKVPFVLNEEGGVGPLTHGRGTSSDNAPRELTPVESAARP